MDRLDYEKLDAGLLWQQVPGVVRELIDEFNGNGFEAYLVGGCVRDLCLGLSPRDWDIATDARPPQVQDMFAHTRPTGIEHGTVTVVYRSTAVEVTTYRTEGEYVDFRHPDQVAYTGSIKKDLARRDFTVNALALAKGGELLDLFGGIEDLRARLIQAVGDAGTRFREDALRMLRAIRFASQLGFSIHGDTFEAVKDNAALLQKVSAERIRDEFSNALLSDAPAYAVELLKESGLLEFFIPELLEGVGFWQNRHHRYTVWEHNLLTLEHTARNAPKKLYLRLAALLHDVAKPRTLSVDQDGSRHFYHHETEGAVLTEEILRRLRFDNETIARASHLVRHHLALHHYPDMTDAAIRRLIRRVGLENLDDLIYLRAADRAASGTKKGPISGGTQVLLQRIEKVLTEEAAFGREDLVVNGHDVMQVGKLEPGPLVGRILAELLEEVLDDPARNTRDYLLERIRELVAKLKA